MQAAGDPGPAAFYADHERRLPILFGLGADGRGHFMDERIDLHACSARPGLPRVFQKPGLQDQPGRDRVEIAGGF